MIDRNFTRRPRGTLAGRNAPTYPNIASAKRFTPLSITFTDPSIAIVGDIPKPGAVDVVTGAYMVGPGIEHLAHLIAWAIQLHMAADCMLAMPFKPALRSICRAVRSSADGMVPPGE